MSNRPSTVLTLRGELNALEKKSTGWAIACLSIKTQAQLDKEGKIVVPAAGGLPGTPDEYCDYAAVAAAEWSDDEVDKVAPAVAGCKRKVMVSDSCCIWEYIIPHQHTMRRYDYQRMWEATVVTLPDEKVMAENSEWALAWSHRRAQCLKMELGQLRVSF